MRCDAIVPFQWCSRHRARKERTPLSAGLVACSPRNHRFSSPLLIGSEGQFKPLDEQSSVHGPHQTDQISSSLQHRVLWYTGRYTSKRTYEDEQQPWHRENKLRMLIAVYSSTAILKRRFTVLVLSETCLRRSSTHAAIQRMQKSPEDSTSIIYRFMVPLAVASLVYPFCATPYIFACIVYYL
jgi:hypothetical protein